MIIKDMDKKVLLLPERANPGRESQVKIQTYQLYLGPLLMMKRIDLRVTCWKRSNNKLCRISNQSVANTFNIQIMSLQLFRKLLKRKSLQI